MDERPFKAILDRVMDNHARLAGCRRHAFPSSPEGYKLGMELTCLHCGGTMKLRDAGTYLRGYAAHGGDPRDIIPDWPEPKRHG